MSQSTDHSATAIANPSVSVKRIEITLEASLNDIWKAYSLLRDRIYVLEELTPSQCKERLTVLENQIRPYEQYKTQAESAVRKLSKLKDHFDAYKADQKSEAASIRSLAEKIEYLQTEDRARKNQCDGLMKRVGYLDAQSRKAEQLAGEQREVNAASQSLLKRVKKLESQGVESTLPVNDTLALSTDELAQALSDRLEQDHRLDDAVATRLRRAIAVETLVVSEKRSLLVRIPFPPATDLESLSHTDAATMAEIHSRRQQTAQTQQRELTGTENHVTRTDKRKCNFDHEPAIAQERLTGDARQNDFATAAGKLEQAAAEGGQLAAGTDPLANENKPPRRKRGRPRKSESIQRKAAPARQAIQADEPRRTSRAPKPTYRVRT